MSWIYDSRALSQRYGEGYFHGCGSGYPPEGYERVHASWRHQLQTARRMLGVGIRWLDVGCAYGYLIEEAQECGVWAVGVDISAYALSRCPGVRDRLVRGEASWLPFGPGSFDVVSAFDLVEHLPDPISAIREWKRVLRPNGLLFLSTPDPCTFDRDEPTHLFERPPAFWVDCLREHGFEPVLRFGGEFFDCEICACLTGGGTGFSLDAYVTGETDDVFPAQRTGDVFVVPRGGWGELHKEHQRKHRWIGESNAIYILNAGREPARCRLSIRTRGEGHPDATVGELRLRHLPWTRSPTLHEWESFDLPVGGSILRLSVGEGRALAAEKIELDISHVPTERYLEGLPFDLYQRYRLVSEVIAILTTGRDAGATLSVLEVGGCGSPLPYFLPETELTVTDIEWEDRPRFRQCDAGDLPYPDGSFDYVVGCDFLEHVHADRRRDIISELKRVARSGVILIGPVADESVIQADALLRRFLIARFGRDNRFLAEHEDYGLPGIDEVEGDLSEGDWQVQTVPNGLLERWLAMQLCTGYMESVPELSPLKQELNRFYNRTYYRRDNAAPAYRTLVLAARRPLDPAMTERIAGLAAPPSLSRVSWEFAGFLTELFNIDLLRERSEEVTQRDEHIAELLKHAEALRESREGIAQHARNLESSRDHMENHAANLTRLLDREQEERRKVLQHADDLTESINRFQEHIGRLENHIAELEKDAEGRRTQWAQLQGHAENLASLLQNREELLRGLQQHAANLQERLSQLLRHSENLEKDLAKREERIKSLLEHGRNLENLLSQSRAQADCLLEHSRNLEELLSRSEERTRSLAEEVTDLKRELADRKERVVSLRERCEGLERALSEKEAELARVRESIRLLEGRLSEIEGSFIFRLAGGLAGKKRPARE